MPATCEQLLRNYALAQPTNKDLAVATIWWHLTFGDRDGLTIGEIASEIEGAGYAKQNRSRLWKHVASDGRTRKVLRNRVGISVRSRHTVDDEFREYVEALPIRPTDSVLPIELFAHTRTYTERVVNQINGSYDAGLYDCTAVMCRRLLETLIIEVYERQVRADELKGPDGHFMMLSGLVRVVEKDGVIQLGREAMRGLKGFKKLGDLSAHNRRFNARQQDIDRVRDAVRIAAEELRHLAWPHAATA